MNIWGDLGRSRKGDEKRMFCNTPSRKRTADKPGCFMPNYFYSIPTIFPGLLLLHIHLLFIWFKCSYNYLIIHCSIAIFYKSLAKISSFKSRTFITISEKVYLFYRNLPYVVEIHATGDVCFFHTFPFALIRHYTDPARRRSFFDMHSEQLVWRVVQFNMWMCWEFFVYFCIIRRI